MRALGTRSPVAWSQALGVAALTLAGGCALVMSFDGYETSGAGAAGHGGSQTTQTSAGGIGGNAPGAGGATTNGGGGSGGAGGAGGRDAGAPCVVDADCPGQVTPCASVRCDRGACVLGVDEGKTFDPSPGDCHVQTCDASGSSSYTPDDTDLPALGDDCRVGVCNGGVPGSVPAADGTPCGAKHDLACVAGACTGCATRADCIDDSACAKVDCVIASLTGDMGAGGAGATGGSNGGGGAATSASSAGATGAGGAAPAVGVCRVVSLIDFGCGPQACKNSVHTDLRYCVDNGQCLSGFPRPCDPYGCGEDGVCLTACKTSGDCSLANYCDAAPGGVGRCRSKQAAGDACTAGEQCKSGVCGAGDVCT